MMLELLLVAMNAIPAETLAAIVAVIGAVLASLKTAAALVGTLTGVVAALKLLVPRLQSLAERTRTRVDNVWVAGFGAFLDVAAGWLDGARRHLELWAGNRFLNEQVVKVTEVKK